MTFNLGVHLEDYYEEQPISFYFNKVLTITTPFLLTLLFDFQFQAFDFRTTTRNEPFLQLFHCLYVYPITVSLSRKRNLFIRVELRKDDVDVRRQPLEVNGCHLLSTDQSAL